MLAPESLAAFVVASLLLSLSPGPDNLFVITQSALYGKRAGVLITLGLCTGLIGHTAAVALGVAAVIQAAPLAFAVLTWLGAGYLAWLAWQAFHSSPAALNVQGSNLLSGWALYRRGIVMNLVNPKVSLFFLAFLPQFARPDKGSVALQIMLPGLMFMAVALCVFMLFVTLAAVLGERLQRSPRLSIHINKVAGLVLAGLALRLVLGDRA